MNDRYACKADACSATVTSMSRRELITRATVAAAAASALGLTGLGTALGAEGDAAPAAAAPTTPDEALQELTEGNKRFVEGRTTSARRDLERLKQIAEKQTPFASILGCADSRVPVEILYDQGFGDLFVVRVAGNVATSVEIASLEFGSAVLGAKAVLVLGHSNCGAVKAALAGKAVPGQISTLFQHIVPALDRKNPDVDAACKANVAFQARKLKEGSPVLGSLIKQGKLKIVGGFYDLSTGTVTPVPV